MEVVVEAAVMVLVLPQVTLGTQGTVLIRAIRVTLVTAVLLVTRQVAHPRLTVYLLPRVLLTRFQLHLVQVLKLL